MQYQEFQQLNSLCSEDKYHYAACYRPIFTPLTFNNTVVAVCGYYVCSYYGYRVYRGELINYPTWCNNREECYNGGVDEKYCTVEEEMFQCRAEDGTVFFQIYISKVCDKKCDCWFCDDEWQCNGYRYHYWYRCHNSTNSIPSYYICDNKINCYHGDDESDCGNVATCANTRYPTRTYSYILASSSRCTPWVMCADKLDQTNCSDTQLTPLQCPINGYASNVSQHIICKRAITVTYNLNYSNTFAVCDDNMDMQCVTPTPGCYIHKHQLCNSITDCKSDYDEKSALCFRVTAQECKRKIPYNASLSLPIGWIDDGVGDCVGGIDEDITKWKSCQYPTFTIYGGNQCDDVYICPSGYPFYVEIKSLCDELLSCQGGNKMCITATLTSSQLRYISLKVEDVIYLHNCLIGLQDVNKYLEQCEHVTYPTVEILRTKPNNLYFPIKRDSCSYVYGEQYVYLSCSGKCYDAECPLKYSPISGHTFSNILKRKTYSISSDGNLVIVQKDKKDFKIKNVFVCGNNNCIPYSKVCNLVDDCGDVTDEDSCTNHFVCNVNSNFTKSYIPLSSVCDGKYDCLDLSDESSCCHRKLINGLILKISSWSIRTLSVIPMIPHFEDTFVNALCFSNINFLRGFITKKGLKPMLASYYGRIRLGVSNLTWSSIRSLIEGMFTNNYGGISHRVLSFYGNDPVCLFRFFVSSDEPQVIYSWSLLSSNFVCFGIISISYLFMFVITSTSSLSQSQGFTGDCIRRRNNRLQRKISIIILTDFLFWVPFIIICFLHTIGVLNGSPWYALLSILILPINSVINPVLYDDTMGRIIGRVCLWIQFYTRVLSQRLRTPFRNRIDVVIEPGQTAPHMTSDFAQKPGHTTTTNVAETRL